MITGWVNNTQGVSFTGSNAQLFGFGGEPGVPQFQVTWNGGDPVYLTKGPFLNIAMPDLVADQSGPAAPKNQPLIVKNLNIDTNLSGPFPPWKSYDTGAGALGAGGGDVFSASWLGNYSPTGNDLPTISQDSWHSPISVHRPQRQRA
jgi:hypothetical protein